MSQTNNKKIFSDRQEKSIADFLGWRQVKGSGARPTHTGDVESDEWLGECKTHVDPGHTIHFDSKIWDKIVDEAAAKFKLAAYFVDDGSQSIDKTWVMLPVVDFSNRNAIEYGLPPVKGTMNFDSDYQLLYLKNHSKDGRPVVYRFCFGSKFVMLTNLRTFKELL